MLSSHHHPYALADQLKGRKANTKLLQTRSPKPGHRDEKEGQCRQVEEREGGREEGRQEGRQGKFRSLDTDISSERTLYDEKMNFNEKGKNN